MSLPFKCTNCGYPSSEGCPICGESSIGYQITGPGRQIGAFWSAPGQDGQGKPYEIAILLETSQADAAIWLGNLKLAQSHSVSHVQRVWEVGKDVKGRVWASLEALPSNNLDELVKIRGKLSPAAASYVILIALEAVTELDARSSSAGVIVPEDITISPERKIMLREPLVGFAGDGRITPFRSPDSIASLPGDIYTLGRLFAFMLTGTPQSLPMEDDARDLALLLRFMCALDASARPNDFKKLHGIFAVLNQGEMPSELIRQLLSPSPPVAIPPQPKPSATEVEVPRVSTPVATTSASTQATAAPAQPLLQSAPPPSVTVAVPLVVAKPEVQPKPEPVPPPPPSPKIKKEKASREEVTGEEIPYREKLFRWIGIYAAILINALILLIFFILVLRKVL